MVRLIVFAAAAVLAALSVPDTASAQGVTSRAPLRSAYAPADFAPAPAAPIVFVDALKQSAPWMSSSPLSLDGDGQVVALLPGQTAERTVYAAGQPHPSGLYTLLYDGRGSFAMSGATIASRAPGRYVVAVGADRLALDVRLDSVDPSDPARNIRLVLPGFDESYADRP